MTDEPITGAHCGLVLNALHAPCHLPRLHEGFHQASAPTPGVIVEWWTPGAPASERRYRKGTRP